MDEELRQPICKGFIEEPTVAGGAREPVVLNFLLGLISIFATSTFYFVPIFFVLHGFIIKFTKEDPFFFTVLRNHLTYVEYYDA